VVKILYSENYNGKYNSDFVYYIHNDFSKYNPMAGESSYFYNSDSFRNDGLSISESDKSISYDLNSSGFRCDEFGKDTSSNFLFGGCSVSFGMGLPYESNWAYKLNKAFDKNNFYNLSVPALSSYAIVNNIVAYIKNYGNPQHIFVMFPDYYRVPIFKEVDGEMNISTNSLLPNLGLENTMFSKHLSINAILMLEFICSSLGIGLTWTTWNEKFNDELKNGTLSKTFNNFLNVLDNIDVGLVKKEKNNMYWDIARDDSHFGEQIHAIFAKVIENEYKKNNQ
jgi:hypothetical protein